jgi:hypothetical protein
MTRGGFPVTGAAFRLFVLLRRGSNCRSCWGGNGCRWGDQLGEAEGNANAQRGRGMREAGGGMRDAIGGMRDAIGGTWAARHGC